MEKETKVPSSPFVNKNNYLICSGDFLSDRDGSVES